MHTPDPSPGPGIRVSGDRARTILKKLFREFSAHSSSGKTDLRTAVTTSRWSLRPFQSEIMSRMCFKIM